MRMVTIEMTMITPVYFLDLDIGTLDNNVKKEDHIRYIVVSNFSHYTLEYRIRLKFFEKEKTALTCNDILYGASSSVIKVVSSFVLGRSFYK